MADADESFDKLVRRQNRKKKKSGGFQSMGLSHAVLTGVLRKGYKLPTPIQRKAIPLILDGKDVVAMARTGSGKTAAFLLPMFERLKAHSAKVGIRALVLSPTRELAMQTLKFTKELGRFTDLRAALILGGDSMEDQFSAMHGNPDIVVATPGRFLHVIVEMDMKLSTLEYVVFDEADRLFEMGFTDQLTEILRRLPESRQTLLFSATLPKLLVDFAKAGLRDPTLMRLDVDAKISEYLRTNFFAVSNDSKTAALLHFMEYVVKPTEQTVIFTATKHHVEYVKEILLKAGFDCTYIYSSLDQTARKINAAKFSNKKVMTMIVTDVAARGIDIPLLDNVINFNFPAQPKLFVHRVGRVARAGRSGTAHSFVSPEEVPYMLELHLFLGRPLKTPTLNGDRADGLFGDFPMSLLQSEHDAIRQYHSHAAELSDLCRVSTNAYRQYVRSRPLPSSESIKRHKEMTAANPTLRPHPLLAGKVDSVEKQRLDVMDSIKKYKPNLTVFEVGSKAKTTGYGVMKRKRSLHGGTIVEAKKRTRDIGQRIAEEEKDKGELEESTADEYSGLFTTVIHPGKKKKAGFVDEENFIRRQAGNERTEKGLAVASFEKQASSEVLELIGEEQQDFLKQKRMKRWDRKKKRFTTGPEENKVKKVRTESGAYISASYKTNRYKEWAGKHKVESHRVGEKEKAGSMPRTLFRRGGKRVWHTKGVPRRSAGGNDDDGTGKGRRRKGGTAQASKGRGRKGRQGQLRSVDDIVNRRQKQERNRHWHSTGRKKGNLKGRAKK